MKKILIVLVLTTVLMVLLVSTALADNGPHGNFDAITDKCASCHRAHTATGPNLLNASGTYALCITCHGPSGTGADTDVMGGVYDDLDTITEAPAEGTLSRGLKSGGFTNVLQDTDLLGVDTAASEASTSAHGPDITNGTLWGSGALNSGTGEVNVSLTCGSCHDPHGGANAGAATYRLLRTIPTGSGVTAAVVADVASKTYTIDDATGNYMDQAYTATQHTELSTWCATCHDRYLAIEDDGSTDSGDGDFAYRHMSDGNAAGTPSATTDTDTVGCMSCHVAHGTASAMTTKSNNASLSGDSALLRLDDRGVCQACHNK